jgi:hypothetical protein
MKQVSSFSDKNKCKRERERERERLTTSPTTAIRAEAAMEEASGVVGLGRSGGRRTGETAESGLLSL